MYKYIIQLRTLLSSKIILGCIIIIGVLLIEGSIFAIEIRDIVFIGNTVDIDIEDIIKDKKGTLTRSDIESLGVKVTNEYHNWGYTTSYVTRLILRENSILEIHINESRILGISISGVSDQMVKNIESMIVPVKGEVYNRYTLGKRIERVKKIYNFDSISMYPINYEDSGDVFLSVKAEKRRGNFYGGIGIGPIYGLSPKLGYFYQLNDSAIDIFSRIGYRDSYFRRVEVDLKYFLFNDHTNIGYYIGVNTSRLLEEWESLDSQYRCLSITPVIGIRYIHRFITFDIYAQEKITQLDKYREDIFVDYDTRLTLDLGLSNRYHLLFHEESSDIRLLLSGGTSNVECDGYMISSLSAKTSVLLFSWLRFIPRINFYYTTSNERFFWSYVYDENLLGFSNDFTSSKWKNIGGIDQELEISPEFVYVGPFINSGYFKDESDKWMAETGGGFKCKILYRKLLLEIYYAWDLSHSPSEGGVYILGGGKF
ncbi:MAG: hypothetical protein SVZ03_05555 [Spirochaetota bacterium]|nr:hypothetical protein [Spirochaetota bacterium]